MTSTSTPTSTLRLSNILHIVRAANARYQRVADELRSTLNRTRTHHAKSRAIALGLQLNMEKARECPQTAVSRIPLPTLVNGLTPVSASIVVARRARRDSRPELHTPSPTDDQWSPLVIRIPSLATRMAALAAEETSLLDTPVDLECTDSASSDSEQSGPETPDSASPCPLPQQLKVRNEAPTKRKCSATELYGAPKQQMKRRWVAETLGRASPHLFRA